MPLLNPSLASEQDSRYIVWFDIDNTLYSASARISDAMGDRIHAYFVSLGLSEPEASQLHRKYYTEYGLALRGLVRHHSVDPLDFDKRCDGSLSLEDMIKPIPKVRKLLQDIDRTKARVWALTNAYITHAQRVLHVLNLEDQIEGLVYCDYSELNFVCKPDPEFYRQALLKANVQNASLCYFIDDSLKNVQAAKRLGWGNCVHFCEKHPEVFEGVQQHIMSSGNTSGLEGDKENMVVVSVLEDLREVWPQIFL